MYLLIEVLCTADKEGCSGSGFTRHVGKEQPSPILQKYTIQSKQKLLYSNNKKIRHTEHKNYLEKTGSGQYFFSSPNTWRKFLLIPKLKPFLSVPCWNAGARKASDGKDVWKNWNNNKLCTDFRNTTASQLRFYIGNSVLTWHNTKRVYYIDTFESDAQINLTFRCHMGYTSSFTYHAS